MNTTENETTLTVDTATRRVTVARYGEPPIDVFLTVRDPDGPRNQEGGSVRMTPQAAEAVAHALLGIDSHHDLDAYADHDQARRERDMWREKWLDTYEALRQARAERDKAAARAEKAERELAPTAPPEDADANPAVHVVRESDVAAVEVKRNEQRDWWTPRRGYAKGATADGMRNMARLFLQDATDCEALARAIETDDRRTAAAPAYTVTEEQIDSIDVTVHTTATARETIREYRTDHRIVVPGETPERLRESIQFHLQSVADLEAIARAMEEN